MFLFEVDGEVFTFGCGSNGRLGHPDFAGHRYLYKEKIPKRVDKFTEMGKEVVCFKSHYYNVAALVD
jgi:regulator of chromosome condensation